MPLNTELFVPAIQSCSEVLAAGGALYLSKLVDCNKVPVDVVVSTAVIAANATTASLTVTTPATGAQVRLRKGQRLAFGANFIVVSADALITNTASTVQIEPAAAGIAAAATATIWETLKLLTPTSLPLDLQSNMVDVTNLSSGLQGSEVKTKVMLSSQIEVISDVGDRALWTLIHVAAQNNDDLWATVVRNDVHAFGRVKVSNYSLPSTQSEVNRPTFTLNFQPPFSIVEPFQYLSTAKQTELNLLRTQIGLAPLV